MSIISKQATCNYRFYTPSEMYVAAKLQWQFFITLEDGTSGLLWMDV